MKTKTTIIIFLFLSIFGACPLCAQSSSTLGTDFWLTNLTFWFHQSLSKTCLQISVPRQCTVNVSRPFTNWDTSVTAFPSQPCYLNLGHESRDHNSEVLHDVVYHVTSTDSIALFAISGNGSYSDKSLVLPTRLLGDEYVIQAYNNIVFSNNVFPYTEFQVVATEDSTTLLVVLSADSFSGTHAGDSLYFTIPVAGMSLQMKSDAGMDLTGSYIKTMQRKPVAVFQGAYSVFVIDSSENSGDYHGSELYEQAVPVRKWGKEFVVPHTGLGLTDYIVVLSSEDNCEVFKNGQLITMLDAGQYYKYRTSVVASADYIVTSKPSLVTIYSHSDHTIMGNRELKSSMTTVAPWEWKTNLCYFSSVNDQTMETTSYNTDALLHIVSKSSDVYSVRLNGLAIGNLFHPVPSAPQFSYATIEISLGDYTLDCPFCEGFTGYVVSEMLASEGFMIGHALPDIMNSLVVGEVYDADASERIEVCIGDSLTMSVVPLIANDSVRWYFGDGSSTTGDTVRHTWYTSGLFPLTAIAYSSCDTCYHSVDTLMTYIVVRGIDTYYADTVVCGDSWVFGDSTYTEGQTFSRTFHNRFGCDSIKIITVHPFGSVSAITDTLSACDSVQFLGHTYRQQALVAYDTVPNYLGCDSILIRAININPSYSTVHEVSIYDTASYTWIDGRTYSESTESPYIVLPARNGCDSIIHLHLLVEHLPEPPDSSAIWVPNAFTPDESANKFFRVFCNDIISAQVSIFTRQGLHVVTFDGLTDAWDGTYNSIPCTQGAYVYMINYTRKSKPKYFEHKTGTVLLIR